MKKHLLALSDIRGLTLPAAAWHGLLAIVYFPFKRYLARPGESDVQSGCSTVHLSESARLERVVCAITVCTISLALLVYACLGYYSRYVIDDHCVAASVREHGFWGAQLHWYMTWTGRYTLTFALSVIELIGKEVVPFLPLLALALWLIGLTWVISQLRSIVGRFKYPQIASLILAELVIYSTLSSTPHPYQVLYWVGGMMTYLAPLILLTFYAGFIKRKLDRKDRSGGVLLLSAGLAFTAGGFSEVTLALQSGVLFFSTVLCLCGSRESKLRHNALPLLMAGLIGSLVSIAVSLPAPGNAIRQASFSPPPDLFTLAEDSLRHSVSFIIAATRTRLPLSVSVALLVPALFAFVLPIRGTASDESFDSKKASRLLLVSLTGLLFVVACCFVPSLYAMSYAQQRTLVVPQFVLVCFTAYWSYMTGLLYRRAYPPKSAFSSACVTIMIGALLVLGPLAAAWRTVAAVPHFRAHAAEWDSLDVRARTFRQQGVKRLTIPRMTEIPEIAGPRADPHFFVNRCVAIYYGLDEVVAK